MAITQPTRRTACNGTSSMTKAYSKWITTKYKRIMHTFFSIVAKRNDCNDIVLFYLLKSYHIIMSSHHLIILSSYIIITILLSSVIPFFLQIYSIPHLSSIYTQHVIIHLLSIFWIFISRNLKMMRTHSFLLVLDQLLVILCGWISGFHCRSIFAIN